MNRLIIHKRAETIECGRLLSCVSKRPRTASRVEAGFGAEIYPAVQVAEFTRIVRGRRFGFGSKWIIHITQETVFRFTVLVQVAGRHDAIPEFHTVLHQVIGCLVQGAGHLPADGTRRRRCGFKDLTTSADHNGWRGNVLPAFRVVVAPDKIGERLLLDLILATEGALGVCR